ncbi:MAG: succinyl-diaminopimelate desuccinylase [Gammaproteobacteria bacterium]|nr:succinyl-diaminopimelate desuccinylase [Gammaproteobacteria bacterium]
MTQQEHLVSILRELIQFPSITPLDAGCQDYLAQQLTALGFDCVRYDAAPVSNLYAQYGTGSPLLVFAGHTDVVPPGDLNAWDTPPFELTEKDGFLYGRGVADMKGGLAAMLVMAKELVQNHAELNGSLGFLITSGEEGDQFDLGTPVLMQKLQEQGICPDYCIVGEPSSEKRCGDTLKIGRRGSLTASIVIQGKQGHVAYPQLADNPIHRASHAIAALADLVLDEGNAYFPPSTLQITQIQAGSGANNVIPGQLSLSCNVRFNTEQNETILKDLIVACFTQYQLNPVIQWRLNGLPFLTSQGRLLEVTREVIQQHLQQEPILSTSGGTSDGRFIAPYGTEVIELGLCNATLHQVNERIASESLLQLTQLYLGIAEGLLKGRRVDKGA